MIDDNDIKMVSAVTGIKCDVLRDKIDRYAEHIREGGHIRGIDFEVILHGGKHHSFTPVEECYGFGESSHDAYYAAVRAADEVHGAWSELLPYADLMGCSLKDRHPIGSGLRHVVSIVRLR